MSERDLYRELYANREIELYKLKRNYYELERKWKERVEYVGRGVNFPINFSEPRCSQVLFKKGKCPVLMLYNIVPSVCNNNDVESLIWYCGERDISGEWYVNQVTELYNVNRKYDEWRESLTVYLKNNVNNYLTKVINPIMNVFTDGDWTIITYVDKLYAILTGNNPINYNGLMDVIKVMDDYYNDSNNKLSAYNNDACYKYVRYIYNDGG